MPNQQHPGDFDAHSEEALAEDPSVTEAALDKVMLRVEGQNEQIKTPPEKVEQGIAEVAQAVSDSTMEIEDAT